MMLQQSKFFFLMGIIGLDIFEEVFFFASVHSVDVTGDFNIHKPFPILEYASKHLRADEPGVLH